MVNTKLISIKRIISKIYSDLGIDEENVPVSDIIEWSAEALEKIEAPTTLTNKVAGKEGIPLIKITDYQAQLPSDCVQVLQVAYGSHEHTSNFHSMRYASGSFSGRHGLTSFMTNKSYTDNADDTEVASYYELIYLTMELYSLDYSDALEKLNNDPDLKSTLTNLLSEPDDMLNSDGGTVSVDQLEYNIVPGYIKTNVKSGYLMVAYTAIPTDVDGYPLVPDHMSFIDALYWYVNMKIRYIQWVKGQISGAVFQHAETKWRFYVRQAYGKAMAPANLDEMESLKNAWVRLIPKINASENFFQDLNQQQQLKPHTKA